MIGLMRMHFYKHGTLREDLLTQTMYGIYIHAYIGPSNHFNVVSVYGKDLPTHGNPSVQKDPVQSRSTSVFHWQKSTPEVITALLKEGAAAKGTCCSSPAATSSRELETSNLMTPMTPMTPHVTYDTSRHL